MKVFYSSTISIMKNKYVRKWLIRFVLICFILFTALTFVLYLGGGGQQVPSEVEQALIEELEAQAQTWVIDSEILTWDSLQE